MTNVVCCQAECKRMAQTRGLCGYHYERARRHGYLEEVALPKRPSAFERYGERALELWQSGMFLVDIARELETSHPTIKSVLRRMGVDNPGRHSRRARMLKMSREHVDWIGQLDHLSPNEALLKAWTDSYEDADVMIAAREEVRRILPLVGRALDRLADSTGSIDISHSDNCRNTAQSSPLSSKDN